MARVIPPCWARAQQTRRVSNAATVPSVRLLIFVIECRNAADFANVAHGELPLVRRSYLTLRLFTRT